MNKIKSEAGISPVLSTEGLEGAFIPVSERWPGYAVAVLFLRRDGTTAIGAAGDNGVYFDGWGMSCEPHSNIVGWMPTPSNAR